MYDECNNECVILCLFSYVHVHVWSLRDDCKIVFIKMLLLCKIVELTI